MLELDEDQKRSLLTTLEHVDKLPSDSEHVLNNARAPSFLSEDVCDILSEQRERIMEYIGVFR